MTEEITDTEKEFEDVANKINDFTTLFNKYNFSYEVKFWDSGDGYSINIENVIIDFYLSGAIQFETNEEGGELK